MNMKKITATAHVIIAGITSALLTTAALAGCSARPAAAASSDAAEPIAVATAQVAMTDVASAIDSGSVVQARNTATITSRILAPVREVRASPGDRCPEGQTLIVLDGDDLAASARAARSAALAAEQSSNAAAADLLAAEACLALARASHDRLAGLQAKRSATAQALDDAIAALRGGEARVAAASARTSQATSAVESARAASDQARPTASFSTIAAPFDGVITEKLVEPGNMASPGVPLLRLEDIQGFRLEVRVDESRIGRIRNGDSVRILLGTRPRLSRAPWLRSAARWMQMRGRFSSRIALPDALGLRSGEFGKARFSGPPRRALTIPSSAIVRRGQLTSVFVVDKGIARVRLVSLSEPEVLAGLMESEVVILSPPADVTDGRRVGVGGR